MKTGWNMGNVVSEGSRGSSSGLRFPSSPRRSALAFLLPAPRPLLPLHYNAWRGPGAHEALPAVCLPRQPDYSAQDGERARHGPARAKTPARSAQRSGKEGAARATHARFSRPFLRPPSARPAVRVDDRARGGRSRQKRGPRRDRSLFRERVAVTISNSEWGSL